MNVRSDFKPERRIVDHEVTRRQLLAEPWCRKCHRPATDAHHIVLRSAGGDDVFENLMSLCREHHREFHDRGRLDVALSWEEVCYCWLKLADRAFWYIEKRYDWSELR